MSADPDAPDAKSGERVVALGPMRHACHACGSCCTGWKVQVTVDERERIERHAMALGVADPIVEGALRLTEDSRCVFLGDDRLCRIHTTFGGTEKPIVCQVFPRNLVRAEDSLRAGADPGCSSTWKTYADGPELEFHIYAAPREESMDPELAATEHQLIRLCRVPGMSLAHFIGVVAGDQRHAPKLPPGFVKRLLGPLKGVDFFITHPKAGPLLLADIAKAATFLRNVDADKPPRLNITKEMSAFTLEMIQRTLFLRVGDPNLPPMGKLVLMLGGAILCAYCYPDIERFGRGLAAWSRISRVPGFWQPFIPDVDVARYILTGVRT